MSYAYNMARRMMQTLQQHLGYLHQTDVQGTDCRHPTSPLLALCAQAMSKADTMEGAKEENGNGNGVADTSATDTDKGEKDRPNKTRNRESETQVVDSLSAARIKQAENAEEKRQKDQALVERYDAHVQEVWSMFDEFAFLE